MTDATSSEQEVVVTRSEERLHVSTRIVPIGRAVLRRVVVTERRTIVVDVRHEEARFEVLPFDAPADGQEGDGSHPAHAELPELVLHEEQVVVTTRIVPTERVRLEVTAVTVDQELTETVRHEEVVAESTAPPAAE